MHASGTNLATLRDSLAWSAASTTALTSLYATGGGSELAPCALQRVLQNG
jgi:hypothetical protein